MSTAVLVRDPPATTVKKSPAAARISRDEAMTRGLAYHRTGRTAEAERLYKAVLAVNPRDADALHLLGVCADATGDPTRAVMLIGQALAIRDNAGFHSNLGMALSHLGRSAEALADYEKALALEPDYPEALNNRAITLEALRRHTEAETAYRRAIAIRPNYAEAWGNLGNTLRSLNRLDEAIVAYQEAVAHNPATPRAALGYTLRKLGRHTEAAVAFRHDAQRYPNNPEALINLAASLGEAGGQSEIAAASSPPPAHQPSENPETQANLGQALQQLGHMEEAVQACERALALRPDYPEALTNLGNALRLLGRLDEAETALRRALALRPTEVGSYNNLALILQAQDRPHEALAVLDLAVALDPKDAETHHHRAMLLLRQGRLIEGWEAYEWRFRTKQAGDSYAQFANAAAWRGEPLEGRTVLLVPEQGFGDTIQFARYAPIIAARGGKVILGVQPELSRLMRTGLSGVDHVVANGEVVPRYDLHCPLLSMPRALGTTLDTIPADIPYLRADPAAAARWSARLDSSEAGLRVGIVWGGNPKHVGDRQRSLAFERLAPLWSIPGVRWFSLQVGDRAAPLRHTPSDLLPADGIEDLAPDLTDFAETAAVLTGLDLVISADTAVAHLAGALGVEVWTLLPAAPDWRWLRSGATTPWYPTMRLFRQDARRDWAPVLNNVADALRQRSRNRT
jgi:tetratricopeptide (TPR) repeat protein